MLDSVIKYVEAGLSVIPVHPVFKTPRIESWTAFQKDPATVQQVKKWFGNGHDYSPAIVTGAVSDNLEILDFDENARQFPLWQELVMEQNQELHKKLVQQTTQNGGIHIIYKCHDVIIPGNKKLSLSAIEVPGPGVHEHGNKGYTAIQWRGKWIIPPVLIETRGKGGYFLAAPGRGYELVNGSFLDIPAVTADERKIMLECAEVISEYVQEPPSQQHSTPTPSGDRPGDAYNTNVTIQSLIQQDGWRNSGRTKSLPDGTLAEMWTRPGKQKGISATVYDNKIHVFTSNATPLEERGTYDPFAYYATTIHYGDFRNAALELAKQGYGVSESKQNQQSKRQKADRGKNNSQDSNPQKSVSTVGPLSYLIEEFIEAYSGTFHVSEIDREFGLISRAEKNNRSRVLNKLAGLYKIKKIPGKIGTWKTIDGDIKPMKLGAKAVPPLDIELPLGISDLAHIMPGNIILVAGAPNGGKTAFLLTAAYNLLKNYKTKDKKNGNCSAALESGDTVSDIVARGIRYCNSEMDETELTDRCGAFDNGLEIFGSDIEFIQRYRDFADVVIPDGINFIDFLEIHEDFFELGKLINEIFENLTTGICFIACQKKQGADYAKGGAASLEKPRLVVNLDRNEGYGKICKIVKCKKTVKKGDNHDGKEIDFDIDGDMKFQRFSTWRYVNEKQRKLYNRDYESKGMEPLPEKEYAFIFRLTGGNLGRVLEHQVERWEKSFPYCEVRYELAKMEEDSRRKPFLDNGWFHAIPRILQKRQN